MVSKKNVVQAIIDKVQKEYDQVEIRTSLVEGYERPDTLLIRGKQGNAYSPDVLLKFDNYAEFFEIDLDQDYKLEKWRLFSLYFHKEEGSFNIVTPEDKLPDLRSFLDDHQINARILFFS